MSLEKAMRDKMIAALKSGDKESKQVYSNILDALKKEAKALLAEELSYEQEVTVIKRMIKQINESILKCPASRPDILEKLEFEKAIISEYMPKQMDEDEIRGVISDVLKELGIDTPNIKDKGKIMKELMPRVKGKADGKLVNEVLGSMMVK